MKHIKKYNESFLDDVFNIYSVGEIYYLKGYLESDPYEIIVLSKKPDEKDNRYWGWSLGLKYKGQIKFDNNPREKDMYSPKFIKPSKEELKEIKKHINKINFMTTFTQYQQQQQINRTD